MCMIGKSGAPLTPPYHSTRPFTVSGSCLHHHGSDLSSSTEQRREIAHPSTRGRFPRQLRRSGSPCASGTSEAALHLPRGTRTRPLLYSYHNGNHYNAVIRTAERRGPLELLSSRTILNHRLMSRQKTRLTLQRLESRRVSLPC